jgi:pyridoxamine 5'-phosphate oxidase
MRVPYAPTPLDERDLLPDPLAQVVRWLAEAAAAGLPEPNAMVLATVGADGPHARHVLLKEVDATGLVFYTNLGSRKAADLAGSPQAACCFPWFPMARQLHVEGRVEAVDEDVASAYWATRPRESQLGGWASEQSRPIADRAALEAQLAAVTERFADGPVPKPPFWGGLRVVPSAVELWQGGPGRLHDRLRYTQEDGRWTVVRLQP